MYSDDHRDTTAACVEFTFRVHSDGRRERLAVVLVRDRDGIYRPGPRRPTGDLEVRPKSNRRGDGGALTSSPSEPPPRDRRLIAAPELGRLLVHDGRPGPVGSGFRYGRASTSCPPIRRQMMCG
jgi:hypothetical protein